MITQEFLSQCSDEQINRGVAWLEAKKSNISNRLLCPWSIINEQASWCGRYFKPSSHPNDIMPIAFANMLSICPIFRNSDTYRVESRCGIYAFNTNPLRAIAEVYILMSVNK